MERSDNAVPRRVMIGRSLKRNAKPPSDSRKHWEVNCVPLSVVIVMFALWLPLGNRVSTARSTAPEESSVLRRCKRFQLGMSHVQRSITFTR